VTTDTWLCTRECVGGMQPHKEAAATLQQPPRCEQTHAAAHIMTATVHNALRELMALPRWQDLQRSGIMPCHAAAPLGNTVLHKSIRSGQQGAHSRKHGCEKRQNSALLHSKQHTI
jgi:hypothetical protein